MLFRLAILLVLTATPAFSQDEEQGRDLMAEARLNALAAVLGGVEVVVKGRS